MAKNENKANVKKSNRWVITSEIHLDWNLVRELREIKEKKRGK